MASPAATAHGETEERDLPAASIAPTSSAGRELPGSPLTSGSCPLARGQVSRGRGVAVETRASAALCEEQKKGCTYSVPKARGRSTDRPSREPAKPPDTQPVESFHQEEEAAKQQRPSASGVEETPDVKSSRKQVAVPQIVITRASKETLISYSSIRSEDQTTIQERADWGPYHRHRNPSTVDAYGPQIKEETGAPNRCRESLC
ncbi:spermatogenesis-associated protein 33 isoform X1 [Equus asinus]|uniref:spermatogenesis-associated protein 33 isoform X1 n=1 Tax=Equus asinus TaxID=9793 RepID=UPI0038F79F67